MQGGQGGNAGDGTGADAPARDGAGSSGGPAAVEGLGQKVSSSEAPAPPDAAAAASLERVHSLLSMIRDAYGPARSGYNIARTCSALAGEVGTLTERHSEQARALAQARAEAAAAKASVYQLETALETASRERHATEQEAMKQAAAQEALRQARRERRRERGGGEGGNADDSGTSDRDERLPVGIVPSYQGAKPGQRSPQQEGKIAAGPQMIRLLLVEVRTRCPLA